MGRIMYTLGQTLIFEGKHGLAYAAAAAALFGEDAMDSFFEQDDYADENDRQKYKTGLNGISYLPYVDILSFKLDAARTLIEGDPFIVKCLSVWIKGFRLCAGYENDYWATKWRIVLDTPEEAAWFTPQVGDDIDAEFVRQGKTHDGIGRILHKETAKEYDQEGDFIGDYDRYNVKFGTHHCNLIKKIKRIVQRNGLPFPQPQELILPEEKL